MTTAWTTEHGTSRRVVAPYVATVQEESPGRWSLIVYDGEAVSRWSARSARHGRRMADEWLLRLCGE